MNSFTIEGGHTLSGSIRPQGAKNEALEILSASLLTDQELIVSNVPEILDIKNQLKLLGNMGVAVERQEKGKYRLKADRIDLSYVQSDEFVQECAYMRGSVLVAGPLMARFGRACFPEPGGDKIGRRRVDTHISGLMKLGAKYDYRPEKKSFALSLPAGQSSLKGNYMLLDEASVTGTANIVMAATLAEGTTTIYNAACEPYIQQLCKMLVSMGANIDGIGSNLLKIRGVTQLHGASHVILPDMIEVGSFVGMAAMNQSSITIEGVNLESLGIIPQAYRRLGVHMEQRGSDIFVPKLEHYIIESFMDGSIMSLSDAPWPGLTPDLLSVMLTVATQCKGSVLIHQKMFESRLFFVDKLIEMGAQIILCDPHRAVVIGHDHTMRLRPNKMASPDIRAGIALLIAAMSAEGTSIINNIGQIDRGYENIDQRLNSIGASIKRV